MSNALLAAADLLDPQPRDVFSELGYIPEPAQQRFHDATEFDVGYGGRAGAGKSLALVMDCIRACVNHPGIHCGLFRRSYPELAESILPYILPLQDKLYDLYGAVYKGSGGVSASPELIFRNGSDIYFRYAENILDVTRRQGGEYQYIGIDERQLLPPDVPDFLMTRVRTGRLGIPVIGMRSTFNPGDIGHADLKERYIERTDFGKRSYHVIDPRTNAPMRDADGNLSGQYVAFVPGLKSKHIDPVYWTQLGLIGDPVRRRQLLDGDWDAGAGLMFSATWRREVHVVEPEQVPIPKGAGVIRARGIDYGMSNPFCCLWGAKLSDDLVVVYREAYQTSLTPTEQAELILSLEESHEKHLPLVGALDPSCWTQYANAKRIPGAPIKSIAQDYVKAGVTVTKAHNDRIGGVRLVHDALRVRPDGMPRLLVYSTCRNLIKQLGGLPRDPKSPEDVNTKAEDHAYDALRYLLYQLLGRKNDTGVRQGPAMRPATAGMMSRAL